MGAESGAFVASGGGMRNVRMERMTSAFPVNGLPRGFALAARVWDIFNRSVA